MDHDAEQPKPGRAGEPPAPAVPDEDIRNELVAFLELLDASSLGSAQAREDRAAGLRERPTRERNRLLIEAELAAAVRFARRGDLQAALLAYRSATNAMTDDAVYSVPTAMATEGLLYTEIRATKEPVAALTVTTSAKLNVRTAALEWALAGVTGGSAYYRETAAHLAGVHGTRYVQHGGADEDRRRAQELADAVLADPEATADERQRMALLSATLTMVVATPAAALRGHRHADAEALRRTEQWRATTDPAAAAAGIATLMQKLEEIPDRPTLPPEIRASVEMMRKLAHYLGPEELAPGAEEEVVSLLAEASPEMPGYELVVPLRTWLSPDSGLNRVAELEGALEGLVGAHLLTPLLQQHLAHSLLAGSGEWGVEGLHRSIELLEQAKAGMSPDHPFYDETLRMLAGALVSVAAADTTPESRARAEEVAAEVLAQPGSDVKQRGPDLFLRSMVGLLRNIAGDSQDGHAAMGDLVAAIDALPADHPLRPVAVGQLGALLADRHRQTGALNDLEAARSLLDEAVTTAQDPDIRAFLTTVVAVGRVQEALRADRPAAETAAAANELRYALAALPSGHALRDNVGLVLALADLRTARNGVDDVPTALDTVRKLVADSNYPGIPSGVVAAMVGVVDVLGGIVEADPTAIVNAIDDLEAQVAAPTVFPIHQAGQRALLGKAYLAAHDLGIDREASAARAVIHLEHAQRLLEELHAGVAEVDVLRDLAAAQRHHGESKRSRETAFAALAAHAGNVLLQTGVAHAVATARGAAVDATTFARWCLADGDVAGAVAATELGRGLTLYAATSALQVPQVLAKAGRPDLAAEWRAEAAMGVVGIARGDQPSDYGRVATDLRHRVLKVLRATEDGRRLFAAPSPGAIGAALTMVGADAFVHLLPGDAHFSGYLLVTGRDGVTTAISAPLMRIEPDGPPARFRATPPAAGAAWRAALTDVCDWAGSAVLEPLLDALGARSDPLRLVLMPSGVLGAVPWAAARLQESRAGRTSARYACTETVLSTAASARQFLDVTARPALPVGLAPVLLADPTGSLPAATAEVLALRDVFYPDAVVLGDFSGTISSPDNPSFANGPGTPAEVLQHLPGADTRGASLLHLACHAQSAAIAEASSLNLTEPLTIRAVMEHAANRASDAPGPLVVLSASESDVTAHDEEEALTLATAMLVAGAVTVVGSQWTVSDDGTAILMFAFHYFIARGQPPADALRSAQLWMLDPERVMPQETPQIMRWHGADLTDVAIWAAFAHHGQ